MSNFILFITVHISSQVNKASWMFSVYIFKEDVELCHFIDKLGFFSPSWHIKSNVYRHRSTRRTVHYRKEAGNWDMVDGNVGVNRGLP